jgi:hypothetical protein
MKPPCGSLIEKCRALGKADHVAHEQQIQHSVYMCWPALVGFKPAKVGTFWGDPSRHKWA